MFPSSLRICWCLFVLTTGLYLRWTHAEEVGGSPDPLNTPTPDNPSPDPLNTPAPENPFTVVWNHPTERCEKKGIHLDFERWGILNNDGDKFRGEEIALFYQLGKWPFFKDGMKNGGLPQLANLDAHLAKVDDDLNTILPDSSFDGFGVIDMEHWLPLFSLNFDSEKYRYQKVSMGLIRHDFPQYNKTQMHDEAKKEFETAARNILEATLDRVIARRPNGKWGYYLYPQYWNKSITVTVTSNDRMSWVYAKSTALYPSVYFKLDESPASRELMIRNTLLETIRVRAKYSAQDVPIMTYVRTQDGPYNMFQEADLSHSILQPANMGASGVVLWGSSANAQAKNECLVLQDYIKNTLGPYCLDVMNYFGNCSQNLCHGRGRCVKRDYQQAIQNYFKETGCSECLNAKENLTVTPQRTKDMDRSQRMKRNPLADEQVNGLKSKDSESKRYRRGSASEYDFDDYVCKCNPGVSGANCDNSQNNASGIMNGGKQAVGLFKCFLLLLFVHASMHS